MTDLQAILHDFVNPGMGLLPEKMRTPQAQAMLLAIGLQESGFATTVQYGGGPAHSYWQFERGGGVKGVLGHPASKDLAAAVCKERGVAVDAMSVWQAMAKDQVLSAALARLLLWTDAASIPGLVSENGPASWMMYLRNWRPGKPHEAAWQGHWDAAIKAVRGVA